MLTLNQTEQSEFDAIIKELDSNDTTRQFYIYQKLRQRYFGQTLMLLIELDRKLEED